MVSLWNGQCDYRHYRQTGVLTLPNGSTTWDASAKRCQNIPAHRFPSGNEPHHQGPFFAVNGVPLKSVVIRHQATWMMGVAPSEAGGRMPDPNLLIDESACYLVRSAAAIRPGILAHMARRKIV